MTLDSGVALKYEALILATGSQPRQLTLPGSELAGIHSVRTIADCDELRADLANGGDTVFIGGGFLNLEVAIEAKRYGAVTVLEMAPQILGRVLSREAANVLAEYHEGLGIRISCGAEIVGLTDSHEGADSAPRRVTGVQLSDGSVIQAERVVVAIGAEPRDELAQSTGIEVSGGIVVNSSLRTSDERIFAIGDCARFPSVHAGAKMRVESVQNATDQARFVAAQLTGTASDRYDDVPWFWSTQGERRLQIAGIAHPSDEARVTLAEEGGKLVVERIRDGEVVAVETINAPGPHMRARRALAISEATVA
ncbi:3-phenylpropionate/trans-cinnamate dioxygenase ferredoxin reductase subunit [Leucobacter exalbidus]|uniref:3-phenylpropionate/trans-cinnamate dioxygenase ferredoxin reductase subunit n=1 Tax=Leucobacter exalbidus TaxID=662960 RepID=A0A940PWC2_9MICO|nr:3-phenylpropionate/trans-cinnamate dioxygenase ferredoxin reductase subunit [Leucobacter exalbidus]